LLFFISFSALNFIFSFVYCLNSYLPSFILNYYVLLGRSKKIAEESSTEALHTTSISTSFSPLAGLFDTSNYEEEEENEYGNGYKSGKYSNDGERSSGRVAGCEGVPTIPPATPAAGFEGNCSSSSINGTDTDTKSSSGTGIKTGTGAGDGADSNKSSGSGEASLQPLGDIELSDMPAIRPSRGPAISLRLKIPPPQSPGITRLDSITKNQNSNIQTLQKDISEMRIDNNVDVLKVEREGSYDGTNGDDEKTIPDNNRYSNQDDDFKLRKLKIKI
jgi:hypothetical protein